MDSVDMLKEKSAVKLAVEICNEFDVKKEILCVPGSEYCLKEDLYSDFDRKEHWSEILEKKTFEKLKHYGDSLSESVKENITGLVLSVGMKMLCWACYHEGMFGLSRKRSADFLNSSFFTSQGIIDNKKAAEELVNEESLNIEQKYRLACIYCFTDQLPILFKQIPRERKKAFYNGYDPEQINQPPLIKFWSYYLMGEIDLLKKDKKLDQYRLESAIKSGSLAAVEYCLKKPNVSKKGCILIYAALEAVNGMLEKQSEMYVFALEKYDFQSIVWTPKDYYTDIICFLLNKMKKSDKFHFLYFDIYGVRYDNFKSKEKNHSNVLECFLDWPYQSFFQETEELIRECPLTRKSFVILLFKICDKIENDKTQLNYGEEKCFDYRYLLRRFLVKSFQRCTAYTLQDSETFINEKLSLVEVKAVLYKLFSLKNFTCRDLDNILLILNYAMYDKRRAIISSDEGKEMCLYLMRKEWWEVLDKFILKCFYSKDETKKFKKDLISTEEATCVFMDFIENCKLDAIQCFIDWTSLSEEELVQYNEETILSEEGKRVFMALIFDKGNNEGADKLCKLLFTLEKTNEFKMTLLSEFDFRYYSSIYCWEHTDNFLQWATSSVDEIKKFKKDLIYKNVDFFEQALARKSIRRNNSRFSFQRNGNYVCDWMKVETFLTWCLSSEKEISEYKKVLQERLGVKIHFNLIRANKWEEAHTFFAWLGLNTGDIQKLKKNTIFENIETILKDLKLTELQCKTYNIVDYKMEDCTDYGELQDRIELLLRWYLCDRESLLEFKSFLEESYAEDTDFKHLLNYFSPAIKQYLIDLELDHFKAKSKSYVLSSPPKKLKL